MPSTLSHRKTPRLREATFALLPPTHLWKGRKAAPLTGRPGECRRLYCSKNVSFRMFSLAGLHIPPLFSGAVSASVPVDTTLL